MIGLMATRGLKEMSMSRVRLARAVGILACSRGSNSACSSLVHRRPRQLCCDCLAVAMASRAAGMISLVLPPSAMPGGVLAAARSSRVACARYGQQLAEVAGVPDALTFW